MLDVADLLCRWVLAETGSGGITHGEMGSGVYFMAKWAIE